MSSLTKIGIIADTHNRTGRTRRAVERLQAAGAQFLIHCGDFTNAQTLVACTALPLYFVFGNNDCNTVPDLEAAARQHGATSLGWTGEITLAGKRIAVTHGHLTRDLRLLLEAEPDYLFSGHSHVAADRWEGPTHHINPGALFRAKEYSVALLDLETDELRFLSIDK